VSIVFQQNMMFNIVVNKKFVVPGYSRQFSTIIKDEIMRYIEKNISAEYMKGIGRAVAIKNIIPEYWDWSLSKNIKQELYCVNGELCNFTGSLTKRLRKYLSVVHNITLSQKKHGRTWRNNSPT